MRRGRKQGEVERPGAAVAVASLPSPLLYPGWGPIQIDPAQILGILPLGQIPASGILDLTFQLGNDPSLNGLTLHLQNVIVTPEGRGYFTNSIAPILL